MVLRAAGRPSYVTKTVDQASRGTVVIIAVLCGNLLRQPSEPNACDFVREFEVRFIWGEAVVEYVAVIPRHDLG